MKTTKKELNSLLQEIADKLNLSTNKEQAIKQGQKQYLFLEYASIYGGYRVVNVGVENGAHYGAFGGNGCEARLKAGEMAIKLRSILWSIEHTQTPAFLKKKEKALKQIKKFGY